MPHIWQGPEGCRGPDLAGVRGCAIPGVAGAAAAHLREDGLCHDVLVAEGDRELDQVRCTLLATAQGVATQHCLCHSSAASSQGRGESPSIPGSQAS